MYEKPYSDSLEFYDLFSYINYFIWSYGLFSMIFRSFGHFLEFLNYLKYRNYLPRQHDFSIASAGQRGTVQVKPNMWGPHVGSTGLFSSLTGGLGQRPRQ